MLPKNLFAIFLPIILASQNVEMYLYYLKGQTEAVKKLPELVAKYPNHPNVLFLNALLTKDGMKSVDLYNTIIEKFPESKLPCDAAVKIGEYFYARGLYSQAGMHLSNIPDNILGSQIYNVF